MTALVRPKLFLTLGAALAVSAWTTPALAGSGGFGPVSPESPNAEGIATSYWFITAFALAILVLVEVLLVTFAIRYRRRRRARTADGAQIHGSSRLETAWSVGPVLILFVIAAFVFVKLPGIKDAPAAAPGGPANLLVKVSGRQFYWQYEYQNGVVAIDELRAPAGRTVELEVTAPPYDVIHSWWIPAVGGKTDAIPGRVNHTWFQARRVGVFSGQCAELCGLNHARMLATLRVMPPAAFDAWLAARKQQQDAGTSPLGREQYVGVCAKCHGLAGEGGVADKAPVLRGSAVVVDPKAMTQLLRNGGVRMPAVGRDWSTVQLQAMTAYLQQRFRRGG